MKEMSTAESLPVLFGSVEFARFSTCGYLMMIRGRDGRKTWWTENL